MGRTDESDSVKPVGTTHWTEYLYPDEIELTEAPHLDPVITLLILRLANERRQIGRMEPAYRKAQGITIREGESTDATNEIKAWYEKHKEEFKKNQLLSDACHASGGHTWGPLQLGIAIPQVTCAVCETSMTAYQLPLPERT